MRTACAFIALFASLALGWTEAGAQGKEIAMVNAVLGHRAFVVGDTTPVDACSVYEALGRPASFPRGIQPSLLRFLDRTTDPCAADSTRAASRWPRRFVRIESISARSGADATVRVVVTRHEYRYRETYTLRVRGSAADVAEVRTWGIVQSLPIPPGRRLPDLAHPAPR
jgi:hypothetical protein